MAKLKTAGQLLALLGREACGAETYGSKTFCYIHWHTNAEKLEKEAMLIKAGYTLDLDYGYQNPTATAVRVGTLRKDYERPFKLTLHWKTDPKTGHSVPSTRRTGNYV